MKNIVQFSGGKDSQATLIWACKKYGPENVIALFLDTLWENPITYAHIKLTIAKLGCQYIELTSKKYNGMIGLVKRKGRFPSSQARFCTEELKVKPFIDWVLDESNDHLLIFQGIRGAESSSRSKMNKECRYFKYYFEPYRTNSMIIEELTERIRLGKPLSLNQKKKLKNATERLALGKEDPKYFTYRKKEVFAWCEKYDDSLIRPFFDASGQYVIDYIIDNGQKPNPLYSKGFKRVGCWICIMSNKQDVKQLIIFYLGLLDNLAELEIELNTSFFPPDYIPDEYCSKQTINKKGKLVKYPTTPDVIRYINDCNATLDMFEEQEPKSCMSAYQNICE